MKKSYNIILCSGPIVNATMIYPINLNTFLEGNYNMTFSYSSKGVELFDANSSNVLLSVDLGQNSTYLVYNPQSSITNISKVIGTLKPFDVFTFLSFQNSPSDNSPVPIYISTGITQLEVKLINGNTMVPSVDLSPYSLILHFEEI